MLQAMDIPAEKIDEIISAHTETVDALKEERDKYKADAELLGTVTKERDTAKSELAAITKDDWKTKYESEHTAFEAYKQEMTAKELQASKESAYKALLLKAGVSEKRVDAIIKVTDFTGIELNKDGTVKEESKTLEGIKSEWADFITTKKESGAETKTPPADGSGAGTFDKMSLADKMNYANEHPDDADVIAWLKA
jgi:hypothetical protein